MSGIVKQEFAPAEPIFGRPPVPMPTLPPRIHKISLEEFIKLEKRSTDSSITSDSALKKIVLLALKPYRMLWEKRPKPERQKWMELSHEVYERTGRVVSVPHLRKTTMSAKFGLRRKLHMSIVKHKMTREQTNKFMWNWEFYSSFIYYREILMGYEARLRGEEWNGEEDDEDDVLFVGIHDTDNATEEEPVEDEETVNFSEPPFNNYQEEEVAAEEVPYQDFPDHPAAPQFEMFNQTPPNPPDRPVNPYQHLHSFGPPLNNPSSSSASSPYPNKCAVKRRANSPNDLDMSADHIAEQLKRVFREHPEKATLIRKAMFTTILAFDDEDYDNLGDLFDDLASQCKAKKSRRQK